MNSKLWNLARSEFRQRRTALLVCLLWTVGGAVYAIARALAQGTLIPYRSFFDLVMFFGFAAPIFLAMRTSLGEMTDRTRSFSDGLPISPRLRAVVRLAGGVAVLLVSIAAAALLLSTLYALGWVQHESAVFSPAPSAVPAAAGLVWSVAAVAFISASCLYLVLCLLGTVLEAESHLGFYGATVAATWPLWMGLKEVLGHSQHPQIAAWIGWLAPATIDISDCSEAFSDPRVVLIPLLVSAVIQLGLAALFVRRYGRRMSGKIAEKSVKLPGRVWWKLRFPSRDVALLWLTLRQSVPLCLPGLALACLITPLQMDWQAVDREEAVAAQRTASEPTDSEAVDGEAVDSEAVDSEAVDSEPEDVNLVVEARTLPLRKVEVADLEDPELRARLEIATAGHGPLAPPRFHYVWQNYKDSMPSAMWVVGILWAVLVGAGVFSAEVDWRVGEFWRTRPISVGRLFVVKFVVGLLAVLSVLDGTVIAAGWNSPHWGAYFSMGWPYFACIVPLHAVMFAIAVAWTCVLRRVMLGALAAIVTFGIVETGLGAFAATRVFEPVAVYNTFGFTDRPAGAGLEHYPVLAAAMGLIVVASILIGWWALGRYDPRRQTG